MERQALDSAKDENPKPTRHFNYFHLMLSVFNTCFRQRHGSCTMCVTFLYTLSSSVQGAALDLLFNYFP